MAYIFLDESGDMGFDYTKPKTSKYFVITCLFVNNHRPVEKIVKNIVRNFSLAERKRHKGELHAHQEIERTRLKLLDELASKEGVSAVAVILNKQKVYTHLQKQKHFLYNFVANILLDRLLKQSFMPNIDEITLVASRRETKKLLNDNFKDYLENRPVGSRKIKVNIKVSTPGQEKCLQVVDFVSWAIYRSQEHGDETYLKVIRHLVQETPLFP